MAWDNSKILLLHQTNYASELSQAEFRENMLQTTTKDTNTIRDNILQRVVPEALNTFFSLGDLHYRKKIKLVCYMHVYSVLS